MQFSATFVILNKRLRAKSPSAVIATMSVLLFSDRRIPRGELAGFQLSLGSNGYATELILHNLSKLNRTCPFRRWIYLKIPLK
jgi:hypothetical protein